MANRRTFNETRPLPKLFGWRLTVVRATWFVLAAVSVTIFFLTQPLAYAGRLQQAYTLFYDALPQLGLTYEFYASYFTSTQFLNVIYSLALGLFIIIRRADEPIAVVMATLLAFSSAQNLTGYVVLLRDAPQAIFIVLLVYTLSYASIMANIFLFPEGNFYPTHFSIFGIRIPTFVLMIISVILILMDGLSIASRSVTGSTSGTPFIIFLGLVGFVGLFLQRQRYIHVLSPIQRQQVKWVLFGMALSIIPVTLFNIFDIFVTPWLIAHPTARVLYRFAIQIIIFTIPFTLFGLTIAFAIFRYRLWDIDYAINRSIGYAIVTTLLVIVFLILFIALQSIILNPIALTLLAIGAGLVFNPVRRRVQAVIDRRVYHLRFAIDLAADYARIERQGGKGAARHAPVDPAKTIMFPGALSGRVLAGYELTDFVGRGGMGEVYKGEVAGKTVAIKLLPGMAEEESRVRFVREAEILERLHHPNVVRVYEYGEEGGLRFMVMDYLEGTPLNQYIHSGQPMNLATVRKILTDLASALDYIHSQGVVHRDLKPANIMLKMNPDQTVAGAILMDFGVAKSVTTAITGTETMGTIDYMAPEQIQSSGAVDQRADVYALGVMLYEMVTGVRPFQGNVGQILFAHLRQPAPDPHRLVPTLPLQVSTPILRALSKLPDNRYASAGELAQAIAA